MTYLVVDSIRLADLMRADTTAEAPAQAKEAAEAMAKRFGTTVTVLAPVAVCEAGIELHWTKELPPEPQAAFGWGGGAP